MGYYFGPVQIWDCVSRKRIHSLEFSPELDGPHSFASKVFGRPDHSVVMSMSDGRRTVWDPKTGLVSRSMPVLLTETDYCDYDDEKYRHNVALLSCGRFAYIYEHHISVIILWNPADDSTTIPTWAYAGMKHPCSIAALPDGMIAVGERGGELGVWSLASGHRVRALRGHRGTVNVLAVARGRLASCTSDASDGIRVWDVASGKCLAVIPNVAVKQLTFLADGRLAGLFDYGRGDAARTVYIWDSYSGDLVLELKYSNHKAEFEDDYVGDAEKYIAWPHAFVALEDGGLVVGYACGLHVVWR